MQKPIAWLLLPLLLFLSTTGPGWGAYTTGGGGNVIGATSTADNAIPRFNGTTGKLLQDSSILIDDANALDLPELGSTPGNPAASRLKLYFRGGSLYKLTSGGIETAIGGAALTGAGSTIDTEDLTANRALISNASGKIEVSGTVSDTELGYLDGVTSALQGQIDGKQATITGSATSIDTETLTASRALISDGTGKVAVSGTVSDTELGYLDGATSNLQTQIDSLSGGSGVVPLSLNEFRLSLVTAAPYMTSDQLAKTQVFWVPATGNRIALWDGDSWETYTTTEKSIKLTDTQSCTLDSDTTIVCTDASQLVATMEVTGTGIPGSTTISSIAGNTVTLNNAATSSSSESITFKVPAGKNLDYFAYQASGTPKLRMILWSNDSTRATALDCSTGVCYTTGDATYRYLGSGRATVAGETQFSGLTTAPAAGGTEAKLYLWNHANRRRVFVGVFDSTNSWSYNSSTIRAANNSSTYRVSYVVGLAEDSTQASYGSLITGGAGNAVLLGTCHDSTTAFTGRVGRWATNVAANGSAVGGGVATPAAGFHYWSACESGNASAPSFYGDNNNPSFEQYGLLAELQM